MNLNDANLKYWSLAFQGAVLFLLTYTSGVVAQPDIELLRIYGEENRAESFTDIYHRREGGYFVCGYNGSAWAMRLEENGDIVWSRSGDDAGAYYSVIETDDGNLLVGGNSGNFSAALRNGETGEIIWRSTYGAGTCNAVIELKSGDFALAGIHTQHYPESVEAYLTVVSRNDGDVLWEAEEEQQNDFRRQFTALRETDNGIVVSGDDYPEGRLSKYDFEGRLIWTRTYQLRQERIMMTGMVSRPGGFAIGGYGSTPENNHRAFYLTLVDNEGNYSDHFTYRTDGIRMGDYCWALDRFPNGGFVMAGQTITTSQRPFQTFDMFRLRDNGDLLWHTRFEEIEFREQGFLDNPLRSVIVQNDNRIVACGHFHNPENNNKDAILIRLAPDLYGPIVFRRSPEDSMLTALIGDSIQFIARASNRNGDALTYEWFLDEQGIVAGDTTVTIAFEQLGEHLVSCRISDIDAAISVNWHVTVTDLFIAAQTPDTLNLTLRRGSSVDFSIDSVAAIEGDDVLYQWRLNDLDRQEGEDRGQDARATVDFNRSGHYIVEGMAYRGDSHDEVVWDVEVRGAIWSFLPEELLLERLEGENVEFQIIPTISDTLNWFTWLYDGGMIREGWDSVFVMNFFELGEHTITGVLADSVESDSVSWTVLVESNSVPPSLSLEPLALSLSASPNPFNSMLTIRFSTGSQAAPTRLAVYDLSGRVVARLIDSHTLPPSHSHTFTWNASSIPAGVYLVRLQSGSEVLTRKVVLLR